jgi:hypothetical protein
VIGELSHQQRDLVGRCGHVGVGEDDEVARRREHARPYGRALAPVRDADDVQPHAVDGTGRLGSSFDDAHGLIRAPVVDDEDLDLLRERGRTRCPVTCLVAPPAEIAEQLVERRTDPFRLVESREHQGEAHGTQ